jgi:periplasmic protein TonB
VSGLKVPLTLSAAGHAVCLAVVLLFLADPAPPAPEPLAKGGIEVVFQPPLPKSEAAPLPEPALQPETPAPPAETPPPLPEPPSIAAEPTPPALAAPIAAIEPPPSPAPPQPAVEKPPKPALRREELRQPSQAFLPTPQAAAAPPQTASAATPVPAPAPSPEASAGYRALLSAWLDSHKRYPDPARQRGEEGRAVLRFAVDRSGRVIDYAVTTSSGYPDLDQSIEEMMRGATLPPFPAGMPQPRMEVSVTIRFSLSR